MRLMCRHSLAAAFHQKDMEVRGQRLGVKLPHVWHGTKAAAQIVCELISAERGDRVQDPVVRPAVVFVAMTKILQVEGIHRHPMWKHRGRVFQIEIRKKIAFFSGITMHRLRKWRLGCTVNDNPPSPIQRVRLCLRFRRPSVRRR